jgi:STE24 endopeptidase
MIVASPTVFLFAPALLRLVLNTSPMPDSPLRRRLDALCRRAGVRYRQILVWDTHNHVGNAAVMGVMPRLRYVLLSDVLLERMSDEQIEAVFAHELGHIVHRHMTWYAIFFVMLILLAGGLGKILPDYIHAISGDAATDGVIAGLFMVFFFVLFGALSRRCERQADVYAARTIEMLKAEQPLVSQGLIAARQLVTIGAGPLEPALSARGTHVGRHGAEIFASALQRVAMINNIPIIPRTRSAPGFWNRIAHWADGMVELCNNWLHGSIAGRMQYLQDLSVDPRRTGHFDRTMYWLYCGLLFALVTSMASMLFSVLTSASSQ